MRIEGDSAVASTSTASNRFGLSADEMALAERVYAESIVIDTLTYMGTGLSDPGYLHRLRDAGVTCCNITLSDPTSGFHDACSKISVWLRQIEEHGDVATLARSGADIVEAKRQGKVAILGGMQNGKPFEDRLEFVRVFHRLGIRAVIPAYHYANYLGAGGGERGGYGLSRFGRNVIIEMNRLGVAVDLSHSNESTCWDALECAVKPVCFTHANPAEFGDHHRNKSPELMQAVAAQGGVIGLTAWSEHVEPTLGRRPTIDDMLDMTEYMIELVGEDHVGFGLDLTPQWAQDGPGGYDELGRIYPEMFTSRYEERNFEGLEDCDKIVDITRGLVKRGHAPETIKKINGGNWLRYFTEVWEPAVDAAYPEPVNIRGGG
jgi:membrane dipeptidase